MEENKVKSEFQIGRNYVKEFNINIIDGNIPVKKTYNYELKMGLSDVNIEKEYQYAQALLQYNISVKGKENDKEYVKILIKGIGQFRAPNTIKKEKFIEFCKYNGTPMVSQNIRAYLKAVTALSDIQPINLPMINFVEFFKNVKEDSTEKVDNDETKNKVKKSKKTDIQKNDINK